AVDHMVAAARGDGFANVPAPAPTWPEALIPQPSPSYPEQDAAKRGRYLAGQFGVCMECHTPHDENDSPIVTRAFEGGRGFPAMQLGLEAPPWPDVIYTSNLTPDESGIKDYDIAKLVKVIKLGIDKDDKPLCPPMPSGAMAPFSGITDADATDIAHYLLSLAPKVNELSSCDIPTGP
ncbi:MAG TPA: c-type cytochrome, partial [Polyangiales bacterium]|nr:c-type cytochrome [Polyangiales bacterium]